MPITFFRKVLFASSSLCLLAIGAAALWCAWSVAGMRSDLRTTQAALVDSVDAASADLAATEAGVLREVAEARESADARLAEALREVRAARVDLRDQLAGANATAAGIRADVQPVLDNVALAVLPYGSLGIESTRLVRTIRDSHDDLYWDAKAALESATVAGRGIAEASEAVGKAAPAIAQAAERNVPGMLDDGRKITRNVEWATSRPVVILKAIWKFTLGRFF